MTPSNGNSFGLLAFCEDNSPETAEFFHKRPVMRNIDGLFDLCLNKRFSKHSRHRTLKMFNMHMNILFVLVELLYYEYSRNIRHKQAYICLFDESPLRKAIGWVIYLWYIWWMGHDHKGRIRLLMRSIFGIFCRHILVWVFNAIPCFQENKKSLIYTKCFN